MLYEEVDNLIESYERSQDSYRYSLEEAARKTVIDAARNGSKKSILELPNEWAAQVAWLKKQWRGEGVSISVHGNFMHMNVTGPRVRRRSLHEDEW